MAAISKMISVTSCSASHTNCRNVLAFLGGMKFWPNTCLLFSRSVGFPDRPGEGMARNETEPQRCLHVLTSGAAEGRRAQILLLPPLTVRDTRDTRGGHGAAAPRCRS